VVAAAVAINLVLRALFAASSSSSSSRHADPAHNSATACTFHPDKPVFHDTIKYYPCCPKKQAYDWDSFLAIPGCQVGQHD
jgi:hypothetical protein